MPTLTAATQSRTAATALALAIASGLPRRARARRQLAGARIVLLLVLGQPREDRARDLVAVLRLLEAALLFGIGHEPDLDEDGRHGGAAEHVEAGLLHAAVREAQRLRHRVLHDLGQARGLQLELRLREVPEDRLDGVEPAAAARRDLDRHATSREGL